MLGGRDGRAADAMRGEGRQMSFIKRAQDAAAGAAEAARVKAGEAAAAAGRTAKDPETQERLGQQARSALGAARRGVSTIIERIDPGVLADLIIKATALQELTNDSLRKKASPYRIQEVQISASIPPGVAFAIGRVDAFEETMTGEVKTSEELVGKLEDAHDAVISLDGTTLTQEQVTEVRDALANEVPEALSDL
jgi:hypothetical protein